MNDTPLPAIRIPARFPWRIAAGVAFCGGFWGLGINDTDGKMIQLAVWCGLFALISFRRLRRGRQLVLGPEGIQLPESGKVVPRAQIEAITTVNRGAPGGFRNPDETVLIHCQDQEFRLPPGIPGRREWLEALEREIRPADPLAGLPGELREFRDQEAAVFGAAPIIVARSLSRSASSWHPTGGLFTDIGLTGVIAAPALAVAGHFGGPKPAGLEVLMGLSLFGLLLIFLLKLSRRSAVRNLGVSGMVVSPGGLALNYGQLKGVLRWNELGQTLLIFRGRTQSLRIRVPGADIVLQDIFDKPLHDLERAITRYSGPPVIGA